MELQRQGSERVSSATGRIRRGEPVGECVLAIADFYWGSFFPGENDVKSTLFWRDAETKYTRRVREADSLAHFVAGG